MWWPKVAPNFCPWPVGASVNAPSPRRHACVERGPPATNALQLTASVAERRSGSRRSDRRARSQALQPRRQPDAAPRPSNPRAEPATRVQALLSGGGAGWGKRARVGRGFGRCGASKAQQPAARGPRRSALHGGRRPAAFAPPVSFPAAPAPYHIGTAVPDSILSCFCYPLLHRKFGGC